MSREFDEIQGRLERDAMDFRDQIREGNRIAMERNLDVWEARVKRRVERKAPYEAPYAHLSDWYDYTCSKCGSSFSSPLKYMSVCFSCMGKKKEKKESSSSNNCCYITSACLDDLGIPRTAPEMMAMKVLTKEHILKSYSGVRDYVRYEKRAPAVVSAIKAREDAPKIWEGVYAGLREVTAKVVGNQFKEAYQAYKNLVIGLEKKFVEK